MGVLDSFCRHKTPKYVVLRSWKLGFIRYSLQLFIILYVFLYQIYVKKGYQARDNVVGWASTKVRGTAFAGHPDSPIVWDAVDTVYPPKEPGALFVTTNFAAEKGQSRGMCAGRDPKTESCSGNCPPLLSTKNGIGVGSCSDDHKFCNLHAWCPVMNDTMTPSNVLRGVGDFQVVVRLDVKFPKFGVDRSNMNGTKLTPGLNLFTVRDMLERANSTFEDASKFGAVVTVDMRWDCDLDMDVELCNPTFNFVRLDDPDTDTPTAQGYQFNYAHHYYMRTGNQTNAVVEEHRDLYKVWGVRFIFMVSGTGSMFDTSTLLINVGAGLALLTVSVIVADFAALHFLSNSRFYRQAKYEEVRQAPTLSRPQ